MDNIVVPCFFWLTHSQVLLNEASFPELLQAGSDPTEDNLGIMQKVSNKTDALPITQPTVSKDWRELKRQYFPTSGNMLLPAFVVKSLSLAFCERTNESETIIGV